MEIRKFKTNFFMAFLLFGLLCAGPVRSESRQNEAETAGAQPIIINSNTLEVNDAKKMVIFTGDVNARRDDFFIECQKMFVFYESLPDQKNTGDGATKIDRIVATGQVKISRAQGGIATAEKAIYYQQDDKLVLTEKPVVKQGDDFVEGNRITIFLKENRSVVEGSENKRVKAIIFQKSEKR